MTGFEIIERPEQPVAVVHEIVPMKELPQFFARAFGQVYGVIHAQGVAPIGPPFAHYLGMPKESVEVEAGFPVAAPVKETGAVHAATLPAGKCVHGVHVGPYETMQKTYGELTQWVQAEHLKIHDDMWEVYLSDPQREPNPSTWKTEIFWPVD